MPDRTIDELNRDLSEVLDELLALPPDAFAERWKASSSTGANRSSETSNPLNSDSVCFMIRRGIGRVPSTNMAIIAT